MLIIDTDFHISRDGNDHQISLLRGVDLVPPPDHPSLNELRRPVLVFEILEAFENLDPRIQYLRVFVVVPVENRKVTGLLFPSVNSPQSVDHQQLVVVAIQSLWVVVLAEICVELKCVPVFCSDQLHDFLITHDQKF